MTIKTIPHVLPEPISLDIRGEIYMPKKALKDLIKSLLKKDYLHFKILGMQLLVRLDNLILR